AVVFVGLSNFATISGDTGAFELRGLPAGETTLEARLEGFAAGRATVRVPAGGAVEAVDRALAPAPGLRRGLVTGPVKAVGDTRPGGPVVVIEGSGLAATAGADGRYRIDGVPEGVYALLFLRDGFSPVRLAGVPVDAAQPFEAPLVTMRRIDPDD